MYTIESKPASKNGWFTPTESKQYYGKYARDGITWHWWGDGTGASNHDNIVRYMNAGAANGQKSVNYVLSDKKITKCVEPDNVAWASQNGNPTTVSVELQPTLTTEGYKKAGWLAWQLEKRYGKTLKFYPHKYWFSTQCPGTISLDRIRQEANKWKSGAYNPAPAPTPAKITFSKIAAKTYIMNKQPTNSYDVNVDSWDKIKTVKTYKKNTKVDIYAAIKNSKLKSEHYTTKANYDKKIAHGFSKADLDIYVAPIPPAPLPEVKVTKITPVIMYTLANAKLVNIKGMDVVKTFALDTPMEIAGKSTYNGKDYFLTKYAVDNDTKQGFLVGDLKEKVTPVPAPVPEKPEWERNLRDVDDTKYWLSKNQELIDITTGKPTGIKTFLKDEEFVGSAITVANGVEYRITDYSYQKNIFNGVPITSLTLTAPGEPNVPPVPENPDLVNKNIIIAFLQSLVKIITDFIESLKKK